MDDGFGAAYDISCGEDAFSGGHFVFVYDEETFVGAFQSYCCADQAVSWSLADGDDRGTQSRHGGLLFWPGTLQPHLLDAVVRVLLLRRSRQVTGTG